MKQELDPEDPVVRSAVLGKIVEDFLESEVGKILTTGAQEDVDKLTEELKTVSPLRFFKVMKLQHEIKMWEYGFQKRLADKIMDGRNAVKILEGDE